MTGPDRLAETRRAYASETMRRARVSDPRVEAAFAAVRREHHLTPPPWTCFAPGLGDAAVTSDPAALYDDVLVVLLAGKGINNGQPSLHAAWMATVAPGPGETVAQIGIGTGYYTAILAELVGPGGRVEAWEIEPSLAARARTNLARRSNVTVHTAAGTGTPLPPVDVVYVSAGAAAPDAAWLRALRPGGRLIFPWQPMLRHGSTALLTRHGAGFDLRLSASVSFVGCVGAGPRDMRTRGIASRPVEETRSAFLSADRPPDESATAIYPDLWFSAREWPEAGGPGR